MKTLFPSPFDSLARHLRWSVPCLVLGLKTLGAAETHAAVGAHVAPETPAETVEGLKPTAGSDHRALAQVENLQNDQSRLHSPLDLAKSSFDEQDVAEGDEGERPHTTHREEPQRGAEEATGGAHKAPSEDQVISEREAELALRVGDYNMAAQIYARIVSQTRDETRRKEALLSLAEVYRAMDDPMRVVSILERFKREYPEEERLPEVLLRLGFLYREIGVPQQAVDAFFGVLKQSFNLDEQDLAVYREITNEASYQIAETYYRMHQYELAAEFFTRLLRAARPNTPERLELLAKCAYSNYFAGDYRRVLYLLEMKDWGNVDANRQAEFRFLRASAYWALHDKEGARSEVVNLADLEIQPNKDPYWNFWWKYVGNELANDLFAQEDYLMAHKLYYSLLHLSGEDRWQLPIIFQIGRCRENIGERSAAREIYEKILAQIDGIEEANREGNLIVLQTRVEDQLKNLAWEQELSRARDLYAPPDKDDDHRTESLASLNARGG